jgi:ribosome biogenesis GTPase
VDEGVVRVDGSVNLEDLGWTSGMEKDLRWDGTAPLTPGRISNVSVKRYRVFTAEGEQTATLDRPLLKSAVGGTGLPAVGDRVGLRKDEQLDTWLIAALAPRRNKLSRASAGGETGEQVIAANIDTVFIFTSLDADFNVRRLERYLAMVFDMGAAPVIILNKADQCRDPKLYTDMVAESAPDLPVIAISALTGDNVGVLDGYLQPGKTVVLVGSSGVGKSTLINHLLGDERQKVGDIRESDSKGRHVTTTRELIPLPQGGMLIDNPGIRELQLWTEGDGLDTAFRDIADLAVHCRFKDCRHEEEPRCAVKQAVEDGVLSEGRFNNYRKLVREQESAAVRRSAHEVKKKGKEFAKMVGYVKYKKMERRGE